MEGLARVEAPPATEDKQPTAGALSKILEVHRRLREQVIGQTAELQLARREGEFIVYLTPARGSHQPHDPVAFNGPAAEPMTAALSGRSGTMIGRDYAGRRVLAAFEPVPGLGLGLVAKIDMAEINEQYLRAGLIAGILSLAAVSGAVLLFFQIGEPMIRRLRAKRGAVSQPRRGATRPDLSVPAGHDAHLRQPGVCPILWYRTGRADRQTLARLCRGGRAAALSRRADVVHARASGAPRGNPQHPGRP